MKPKAKRRVFVIMPFTETPTRKTSDLDEFFLTNLKGRIEDETALKYQYIVGRSDDTFDITTRIVRDIYAADIVLCDLSGPSANPNVMYELGMRLALTNKPVILIRESHPDNRRIFDISGFHAHEYSPHQYRLLEDYVIGKLAKFESGEEVYESPVLRVLKTEPTVLREVNRNRTKNLLASFLSEIQGMQLTVMASLDVFFRKHDVKWDFSGVLDVLTFLRSNQKSVSALPWITFVFEPHTMPAINSYLVEFPLDGFISPELELQINTLISQFFNSFLANRFTWHETTFQIVYLFVGESFLVSRVLDACIALLATTTEDDAPQIEKAVWKMLGRSNLLHGPLASCPTVLREAIEMEDKQASNQGDERDVPPREDGA